MFQNFLWHGGKLLQMIALIMGPYALYMGLQTHDARRELTLLLSSVFVFLAGLLLVRYTESKG